MVVSPAAPPAPTKALEVPAVQVQGCRSFSSSRCSSRLANWRRAPIPRRCRPACRCRQAATSGLRGFEVFTVIFIGRPLGLDAIRVSEKTTARVQCASRAVESRARGLAVNQTTLRAQRVLHHDRSLSLAPSPGPCRPAPEAQRTRGYRRTETAWKGETRTVRGFERGVVAADLGGSSDLRR